MSSRVSAALFVLLAATVVVGPLAATELSGSTAVGPASAGQTTATASSETPPGTTVITVRLDSSGDAKWTITRRFNASSEEEREAFGELANRYDSGRMTAPWLDTVRAANDAAENATGRQMDVTDVRKSSDVKNTTLTLGFTWTNFAREGANHFVVDDAFNTTHGTWLDGLTGDQVLVIELPKGYGVLSAPTGAQVSYDEYTRVRWEGPRQFEPGYMQVEYSGDASRPNSFAIPDLESLIWGGFFVLGLVVVGAYVISQRQDGLPSPPIATGDGTDDPSMDAPPDEPTGDVDAQRTTAGSVEPVPEAQTDDVDEELLSDEERVERLLESNGGRMKQANIVKETGWSNAKVSQLLSAMAEEGTIDKLRIGRENLISFPDEDVTDVDQDR